MKIVAKVIGIIIGLAFFVSILAFVEERIYEIKNKGAKFLHKPYGVYERYIKRPLDCFLSCGAMIVLSPVLLILMIVGAIKMKGNPFFTQERPGRIDPKTGKETIFRLIKFRTMTNEKDANGIDLPDEKRLTRYGKLLRSTSLDELPELWNIIKGDMAIIGPRPLIVEYLPYYDEEERKRHMVRTGLTGLAQINGRSYITWEEIFSDDLLYNSKITLSDDVKIILNTVVNVLKRKDIADVSAIVRQSDGSCYININGEMRRLHQPLNVERRLKHVK